MHIITGMEPIKGGRGRARIFLDGAFAFILYKKEIKEMGLLENGTLTPAQYDEIMHTVLIKRARLRAMRLLEKRPYTEKGLRDKLADGEYPASVTDDAIAYVASYGYIDDAKYAGDYAQTYLTRKSRRRILADLLAKGVEKTVAEEAVEEVFSAQDTDVEKEQIALLLRKKHYDPSVDDTLYHQKIYGFLMRKGFSHEAVKTSMRSFLP